MGLTATHACCSPWRAGGEWTQDCNVGEGGGVCGGETCRLHGQVESILSCETAVALHELESMRSSRAKRRAWAASRSRLDRRTRRIMRPRPVAKRWIFGFFQKSSLPQINLREGEAVPAPEPFFGGRGIVRVGSKRKGCALRPRWGAGSASEARHQERPEQSQAKLR